ncbi:MAG: DUF5687 family protein [Bacteroidota bacterium]
MFWTLLRLQVLAFRRAPYLGGRLVLAVLKALGLAYAVLTAAAMGFLLPDTLSVWAPDISALDLVRQMLLPALGALTVGRVLFQDVPTRGAEAFLLLPVPRRRVARAVTLRATLSVFNLAPLAFAVPFALRTVRSASGEAAAVGFVVGVIALVAVSHFAVVVWKTRLGTAPAETLAAVGAALAATAAVVLALGGPLGDEAGLTVLFVTAIAALLGVYSHRSVVESLYLDPAARASAPAERQPTTGFEHAGVRALLDLEWRLLRRTRFPRGIALNALALTLAVSVYAFVWNDGAPAALLLMASTGTFAISAGQFALPFASGHYDRLLSLPGALHAFVAAKLLMGVGSALALGAVQFVLALALAPGALLDLGVAVLFCAGVLAPVAVLGSTLGPKPLDVQDKFMGSPRIQSLPPQIALALAGAVAVGLIFGLGPGHGLAATAAVGAAGVLALPLWARLIETRLLHQRHPFALRFRSVL